MFCCPDIPVHDDIYEDMEVDAAQQERNISQKIKVN